MRAAARAAPQLRAQLSRIRFKARADVFCSLLPHAQTFLTLLSGATAPVLEGLLSVHILKGLRPADLSRAPPEPPGAAGTHVLFEQYWVEAGPAPLPDADAPDEFVLTPSVRGHLATLARAALLRKHPILLQVRRCVGRSVRSLRNASAKMQNIPRTELRRASTEAGL